LVIITPLSRQSYAIWCMLPSVMARRADTWSSFDHLVGAGEVASDSTLRWEDDAVYHALVAAFLSRSADVGTTIRRDHVVNRVNGNPHPFAVHFDFVVVVNHSTLGRATIHQVAARTFAVISLELRVEILMPVTVAHP
jgi:hypothetical protein